MVISRSTTRRDRHRRIIAKNKPPCALCNEPIDYQAPHLDPGEYVADHIIPLNKGGLDVIDNKQPAHRACNRAKSDTIPLPAGATYITTRQWA